MRLPIYIILIHKEDLNLFSLNVIAVHLFLLINWKDWILWCFAVSNLFHINLIFMLIDWFVCCLFNLWFLNAAFYERLIFKDFEIYGVVRERGSYFILEIRPGKNWCFQSVFSKHRKKTPLFPSPAFDRFCNGWTRERSIWNFSVQCKVSTTKYSKVF